MTTVTRWGEMTMPALRRAADAGALVIVPVGSTEQHGPHLPVDTDTRSCVAVAEAVAERRDGVLVAPAIAFGFSPLHVPFGGTISLRPDTMLAVVRDVAVAVVAAGFRRLLFLNGHNSNKPFLAIVLSELVVGHDVAAAAATYYDLVGDAYEQRRESRHPGMDHAGEFETSLLLHLFPALIDRDAPHDHAYDEELGRNDALIRGPGQIAFSTHRRFPTGVIGDPRSASEATGAAVFDAAVSGLLAFIDDYLEAG